MTKYFIPRRKIRYTVYTQDKINTEDDCRLYGTDNRRRKFIFKGPSSQRLNGNACKIAIESIKCRDMSLAILDANGNPDHDLNIQPVAAAASGTQKTVMMGNTDEKELYSIRASFINSNENYDTRPVFYKSAPIIYVGSLNFNNTNPMTSYCYDISPDILNNDITLYLDSNYKYYGGIAPEFQDERGIVNFLDVAITFIIFDGDEVEAIDGYRPDFNSQHISNRDRV